MVATVIKKSGNALVGHRNYVLTSALAASAEVGLLGVSNLQNDQGSAASAWQTPVGSLEVFLLIDAGQPMPWRLFGLFRTNLTANAIVRWRLANNVEMVDPIWDSGYVNAGIMPGYLQHVTIPPTNEVFLPAAAPALLSEDGFYIEPEFSDLGVLDIIEVGPGPSNLIAADDEDDPVVDELLVDESGNSIITEGTGVPDTGVRIARFCRLDISDNTNPDLFINIPLLYAGDAWEPGRQISSESAWGVDAVTDEVTARNGQEYPIFRYEKRRWDFALAALPDEEVFGGLDDVLRWSRRGGNVLFVPFPTGTQSNLEAVMGRLTAKSDVTYPFQSKQYRAVRATVTERL